MIARNARLAALALTAALVAAPFGAALADNEAAAVLGPDGTSAATSQVFVLDDGASLDTSLSLRASSLDVNPGAAVLASSGSADVSDQLKLVNVVAPAGLSATLNSATVVDNGAAPSTVSLALTFTAAAGTGQGVYPVVLTLQNARSGSRVNVQVMANIR